MVVRGKQAREVYALLKCSYWEYTATLEVAQKKAAGDASMPAGREKILLAANALQHILPVQEKLLPYCYRFRKHHQMVIPGRAGRYSSTGHLYELIAMAVCPALYGLMHFLAWSDHFPTPLERLLWRVSTVVVTCSGFVATPPLALLDRVSGRSDYAYGDAIALMLAFIALIMAPIAHVFSSGFLIVESFRQLFFLEPTAYQLPSWSNYWPHLS